MKDTEIFVQKSSGEWAPFSTDKLRKSLLNSGATLEQIEDIIQKVKEKHPKGCRTKDIFRLAYQLLKKAEIGNASRYKLKQGMMELGPAGFAFEFFVAALMNAQGYEVSTGQFRMGLCVQHEIDVIARKGEETIFIECKYHNLLHVKCDVKVPLYIRSRFNDLLANMDKEKFEGWIVTNTSFTEDAFKYGQCARLRLMSWAEPKGEGLKDLIDRWKLYPLTCLSTISKEEKIRFLEKGIVLCKDLSRQKISEVIKEKKRTDRVLNEIYSLCGEGALS